MSGVIAWRLTSEGPRSRWLVTAKADELRWAGPLFGSTDRRIGFFTGGKLWQWTPADDRLDATPSTASSHDLSNYRMVGDEVVFAQVGREQGALTVSRLAPDGQQRTTTILPAPRGDVDSASDTTVHAIGARGASLFLHWGNALVLIDAEGHQRWLNIEPLLKRRTEWAGVAIPTTDALWIGVEVGGGRDFVQLTWSDFDQRATTPKR